MICTKCKVELEATLENFPPDKQRESGLSSWCRSCKLGYNRSHRETHGAEVRAKDRRHYKTRREDNAAKQKRYLATVEGYLNHLYHTMSSRCERQRSYTGVENKFESPEHFTSYVMNVLQVDPRGRDIHRINNDSNYEPGNIEFLTEDEHVARHNEMRCA